MRFDRLLAGSALALVLAAGVSAYAGPAGNIAVGDVPATEPAKLVITPADIGAAPAPAPAAPAATARSLAPHPRESSAIPMTEPAEVVITPADINIDKAARPAKAGTADKPAASDPLRSAIPALEPAPGADPATTSSIPVPATPLVAPTVTLDPLGERLRDALAEKTSDRLFDRKTRASLNVYYAARNYAPIWSEKGAASERAKAVIALLGAADAEGLDPADYIVPKLEADAGPDALAIFELRLTDAVLDYARHVSIGRVHWAHVARDIVYYQTAPEAAEVLGKLAAASDARAALDGYNPQHPAYKALKAKLAEIRGGKKEDTPTLRIAAGPVLKVGMKDARIPDLRERLGVGGAPGDTTYDDVLADAVKNFQKEKKLAANGRLTPATVDALNGKVAAEPRNAHTVDIILANLERWRWVPHELGPSHVIVNIPEFMLRVYNNGSVLWQTRVVVGKPGTPTPLLTETMKFITVNPTWNVPPSIVYGEYLPALRSDPTVLARMGLRVSYNRDGGIHISQPPGAGNALGRIRFNFPNKFLVYQHDTPDKHLFAHDRRAYSHGCMRVQDPDKYAEALLSIALPNEKYTAARIRGMFGGGEVNINFPTPIPVHLTYQTAFVDASGKLQLRDDVYGRDSRVIAGLKTEDRKFVAAPAVDPNRAASAPSSSSSPRGRRQVYRPLQQPRYGGGFNFFGLFR